MTRLLSCVVIVVFVTVTLKPLMAQDSLEIADSLVVADQTAGAADAARSHLEASYRFYPRDLGTSLYEARAALDSARESGQPLLSAEAQLAVGRSLLARGDTLEATAHLDSSLTAYAALDDLAAASEIHLTLAGLAVARRDTTTAVAHYRQAFDDGRKLNDNRAMSQAGAPLTELLVATRQYEDALTLLPDVREAAHRSGDRPLATRLDLELAKLQWLGGMQQTALSTAQTAVVYANGHGDLASMHDSYAQLAQFEEEMQQPEDALRHYRLAWELDRTALQQQQVRQLTVRDSMIHQREQRIESLEKLVADLNRSHEKMQSEAVAAREELKDLDQTRKSAHDLLGQVRTLAGLLIFVSVVAFLGWLKYTRLRTGVLREIGNQEKNL